MSMPVKIINTITDFPLTKACGSIGTVVVPFELEPPEEGARLMAYVIKRDTGLAPKGTEGQYMIDKSWAQLIQVTAQWVVEEPSELEKELEQLKQEHLKLREEATQMRSYAVQAGAAHLLLDAMMWPKGGNLVERIRTKMKPIEPAPADPPIFNKQPTFVPLTRDEVGVAFMNPIGLRRLELKSTPIRGVPTASAIEDELPQVNRLAQSVHSEDLAPETETAPPSDPSDGEPEP